MSESIIVAGDDGEVLDESGDDEEENATLDEWGIIR